MTPTAVPATVSSTTIRTIDAAHDGTDDLLYLSGANATVLRRSGGTFLAPVTTAISGDIVGTGDFSGDANPDIVVKTPAQNLEIHLGYSNGTFGAAIGTVNVGTSTPVVVGDFSGDGNLDVATLGYAITIYRGNGAGGLTLWTTVNTTVAAYAATVGDFDHDGKLDIAAAEENGVIAIVWNNGGGTFAFSTLTGTSVDSIVAADFNGDGVTDLAAASSLDTQALTRVHFGAQSNRSFGASTTLKLRRVSVLRAADIDNDGFADLVTLAASVGTVGVAKGSAAGTFATTLHVAPEAATSMTVGNFDSDTLRDVAFGPALHIIHGQAIDGPLHAHQVVDVQAEVNDVFGTPRGLGIADFNGDDEDDIVTVAANGGYRLNVLRGVADAPFLAPVTTPIDDGGAVIWSGNFDEDLNADVIVGDTGFFTVYYGNTDGTFRTGAHVTLNASAHAIAFEDFNGDDFLDVLDSDGILHFSDAGGAFSAIKSTPITVPVGATLFSGDFENNGTVDVMVSSKFYANDGTGTFDVKNVGWNGLRAFADFNGDGFRDYADEEQFVFGNAKLTLATFGATRFAYGTMPTDCGFDTGDINRDDKLDLVGCSTVLFGNGDGTFSDGTAVRQDAFKLYKVFGRTLYLQSKNDFFVLSVRAEEEVGTGVTTMTATPEAPHAYADCTTLDMATMPEGFYRVALGGVTYALGYASEGQTRITAPVPLPVGTSAPVLTFTGTDWLAAKSQTLSVETDRATTQVAAYNDGQSLPIGNIKLFSDATYANCLASETLPTGTTTYREGTTVLGTVTVGAALTILDPAVLPLGTHTVTIEYSGDTNYLPSTGQATFTVVKGTPLFFLKTNPATVLAGKTVSLTAYVAPQMKVTGSVTFMRGTTTLGTANVVNGEATIQTTFPTAAYVSIQIVYSGDANYNATTQSREFSVYATDLTMAPQISVTTTSCCNATISIASVAGAVSYDIYRSVEGGAYTLYRAATTNLQDSGLAASSVFAYKVIARGSGGETSPASNADYTATVPFTDSLLTGARIKATHVTELQTAVNLVRKAAGLAPVAFTAVAAGQKASAATIVALRNALTPARTAFGLTSSYTDASLAAGTSIRAAHVQELRDAVK
ncbi:MAG TPA: FG-GAP-like repeat-containing protein [Thermoanaerobaculia bacterium]|nr:FG-GAP-like repeat-containing protein [Thermoanaerobaculia bacterium]